MSLRGVSEPVGLLGLTMYTRPAELPARSSMVGKSCSYILLSGTSATSMPAVCASLPSAGKVGAASTSFLPGLRKAMAAMHRISPEPQPGGFAQHGENSFGWAVRIFVAIEQDRLDFHRASRGRGVSPQSRFRGCCKRQRAQGRRGSADDGTCAKIAKKISAGE